MPAPYVLKELKKIMHRNTKENVKSELELPAQEHHLMILDLSNVEQLYYDDLLELFVKLHQKSKKEKQDKRPEFENEMVMLRSWFLQLRQTCCHPQIGHHNRVALGGKTRTMPEVLAHMLKKNEKGLFVTEKQLYVCQIKRAHALEYL
jgi:E3 ubiquitin-protein ligase SHPRH